MRLIDADDLESVTIWVDGSGFIEVYRASEIDNAPTIDAVEKKVDVVRCNDCKKVEVVRCKDCKHWKCNQNTEEWGKCKWISDEQFDVVMNADDFCSYGERRE